MGRQANGEGGIRTRGEASPTPVFETGPFGRSGTSPTLIFLGFEPLRYFLVSPCTTACTTDIKNPSKLPPAAVTPPEATPPNPFTER